LRGRNSFVGSFLPCSNFGSGFYHRCLIGEVSAAGIQFEKEAARRG
jgi:hypothetical protein